MSRKVPQLFNWPNPQYIKWNLIYCGLSATNMRLNPESLVLMNYTIVTSVKNSSWEVPGSLRWKLVVLGGFWLKLRSPGKIRILAGQLDSSQNPGQISPGSQIPAKIPAKFPRQPDSSQNPSQISPASQIPAKISRPANGRLTFWFSPRTSNVHRINLYG